MSGPPISRAELRRLISEVLRTDSDLEAFVLDYFLEVKRNYGSGMTRDAKVSLLLEAADVAEIYNNLKAAHPEKVARSQKLAAVPAETPAVVAATPGTVEIVVLTALGLEFQAVSAHLQDIKEEQLTTGTLADVGSFTTQQRKVRIAVIEAGAGNNSAGGIAQEVISHYRPELVMFVGVAGGIKDVRVGDVVAATKVYGYESGKADKEFLPRPDVGESSYKFVQRARAEARRVDWLKRAGSAADAADAPRAFIGPIAAGSSVVSSTQSLLYQFIRASYGDSLAVEMEGRGFLEAAHRNRSEALIVRGISDVIDGKAAADRAGSQQRAAKNAAAFAFEVIAKAF